MHWLPVGTIDVLEEDKERLRTINHQLKHEDQRPALGTYKDTSISCRGCTEKAEHQTWDSHKRVVELQEGCILNLINLPCLNQGSDWEYGPSDLEGRHQDDALENLNPQTVLSPLGLQV